MANITIQAETIGLSPCTEEEVWVSVPGYPDYEASNLGKVRSIERLDRLNRRRESVVLRQFYDSQKKYLCVNLRVQQRAKVMRVHRIIAMTFIPNDKALPEVNHKDECTTNNRASNLEWCDHRYNNTYGSKKGKWVGEKNVAAKFSAALARYVHDNHVCNNGKYGSTELSKLTGISVSHVSAIAHGNRRREELNGIHP